jgi:reactive intermediate/imine deaminase
MAKTIIATNHAPAAIGTYSQAVRVGDTIYMSGQIGLDPATMQMVDGIDAQIVRVFENLKAVAEAAGGSLADAAQRLPDRPRQPRGSTSMAQYFQPPARAAIGVVARRR